MKRKKRARRGTYYPHIYFESKKPGRDSVFMAVPDISRPGVNTPLEVKLLAVAQLADVADSKTKTHSAKTIPFSSKLWRRRLSVLFKLGRRYGGLGYVAKAAKLYGRVRGTRSKKALVDLLVKEFKISPKQAWRIVNRVS